MRAESLHFSRVRNHRDTFVSPFAPRVNIFSGPNGAGKTSLLEALSFTTITKSFVTHSDAVLIASGDDNLRIEASFKSDLGVQHRVKVELAGGPPVRKTITANNERLRSSGELIGRSPVVVITPDDKIITSGPPSERRRFLNMVLSQASRTYFEDELEFKRALKQRNAILNDARTDRRSLLQLSTLLEPWTDLLVRHAARVMRRRAEFTIEFYPFLTAAYKLLADGKEEPTLRYQPMGIDLDVVTERDCQELLREELMKLERDELRRGTSLIGAHRDDIALFINPGQSARDCASQGQHKTLLVSMKLAEYQFLREATGETPILLLDDVFSELDTGRAAQLLELATSGDFGQTFITSADRAIFERSLEFRNGLHSLFLVDAGHVEQVSSN
ncbi:MAG: DNA replication and repair protein RecF [Candidatus Kapaibacterium sp.]